MRAKPYIWEDSNRSAKKKRSKSGPEKRQIRYAVSLAAIMLAFLILLLSLFDLQVLRG